MCVPYLGTDLRECVCALLGAYTYQALVPGGDSSHSNDRRRLLYTGVCVCVCRVSVCICL